jgi:TolA-binding protein
MNTTLQKTILALGSLLILHTAYPRQTVLTEPETQYREGKHMFEIGNYAGCIARMQDVKRSPDAGHELIEEADYLTVASNFHQNSSHITEDLHSHLTAYPFTIHSNEIYFMLGTSYYLENNYPKAIRWFTRVNLDKLSPAWQEDCAYRSGYSYIETGNQAEAERLFGLLQENSSTYRDAATYYLGSLNYTTGDYSESLRCFNKIKDNPIYRPDVRYYLNQINFAQHRYSQTLTEGLALLREYPDNQNNPQIRRIIGLSAFEEGDYDNTVKYLKQYIDNISNPDTKDLYTLALASYYQKNYTQAIAALNRTNPGDDELGQNIYHHLGQAYLATGDMQNALIAFQSASAMNHNPEISEAATYNYAMLLHRNSGQSFGRSVAILEQFINTYPGSIYADKASDALIDVYTNTRDYHAALTSIAKIKNPSPRIQQIRQKIHYYLGTLAYTNEQYDEAITQFTDALTGGNHAPHEKQEAIYWRGETYYKTGNYEHAAADYQTYRNTAPTTSPNHQAATYNIAYCHFNRQQYTAAARHYQLYIQTAADKATIADAWIRLGDCNYHNRHLDDAIQSYNRAIELSPTTGDYPTYQNANILGLQKNYQGKIRQMDILITQYPRSPYISDAIYEKGRAQILQDNTRDATATYQTLLTQYPNTRNARRAALQIALMHYNNSQTQQAIDAYKEVIARYPNTEEAQTALHDLKTLYIEQNDITAYAAYLATLGPTFTLDPTRQDTLTYFAAERQLNQNQPQAAQTALQAYLQQYPSGAFNTEANYHLATIYNTEKQYEKAITHYRRVIDAGPGPQTEPALTNLATIYYDTQNYQQALETSRQLLQTATTHAARRHALLYTTRAAGQLKQHQTTITAANELLQTTGADDPQHQEALYHRAKAYLATSRDSEAAEDLIQLSVDTRTPTGAESKYLLAQYYYDHHQPDKTREQVQQYIRQSTPHHYWLARSIILLAQTHIDAGEPLIARQYLETLLTNYKTTGDDIPQQINQTLNKIK